MLPRYPQREERVREEGRGWDLGAGVEGGVGVRHHRRQALGRGGEGREAVSLSDPSLSAWWQTQASILSPS